MNGIAGGPAGKVSEMVCKGGCSENHLELVVGHDCALLSTEKGVVCARNAQAVKVENVPNRTGPEILAPRKKSKLTICSLQFLQFAIYDFYYLRQFLWLTCKRAQPLSLGMSREEKGAS